MSSDALPDCMQSITSALPDAPDLPSVHALCTLLESDYAPPPAEHRHLSSAFLTGATAGDALLAAACGRAALALFRAAPRAYDALLLDTVARKIARRAADGTDACVTGMSQGRKRTRGAAVAPEVAEDAQDVLESWAALRALVPTLRNADGFCAAAALAFAGLLKGAVDTRARTAARDGFEALLDGADDVQKVVRCVFSAVMPVVVAPKLPVATRNAIASVVAAGVNADNQVREDASDATAATPGSATTSRRSDPLNSTGRRARDPVSAYNTRSVRRRQQLTEESLENPPADQSTPTTSPASAVRTPRSRALDSTLTKRTTLGFAQAVFVKVPERADDRACVCTLLLKVLALVDDAHVARFASFVETASCGPRTRMRVFAAEVATAMLSEYFQKSDCDPPVWVSDLRDMLVRRGADAMPAVRAKAISCLCSSLEACTSRHQAGGPALSRSFGVQTARMLLSSDFDVEARAGDPKSGVRKAIVQLVSVVCKILALSGDSSRQRRRVSFGGVVQSDFQSSVVGFVKILQRRCEDSVATVRRYAMQSVTELVLIVCCTRGNEANAQSFSIASQRAVMKLWIDGILPRIADPESAVQEDSLTCFRGVVLDRFTPTSFHSGGGGTSHVTMFMESLCGGRSPAGRYASRVIQLLVSKGLVDQAPVQFLQRCALSSPEVAQEGEQVSSENQQVQSGAWSLLAEMIVSDESGRMSKHVDGRAVTDAALSGTGGPNACRIAAAMADSLQDKDRKRLSKKLFTSLSKVASMKASEGLADHVEIDNIPVMTRALASLDPECGTKLLQCVESSTVPDCEPGQAMPFLILTGEICATFSLDAEPSAHLVAYLQSFMRTEQTPAVRATAIAALGNMCLCDVGFNSASKEGSSLGHSMQSRRIGFGELLARRCVLLFVRELSDGGSTAARMNALVVLCDLCRRYTSIVEPHLARLAMCLRDDSEVVRNRALSSLTPLLQEDYLKLRGGPLFFRLVLSLLDSDDSMRRSAEYVLEHVLKPKAPMLFVTNFIEIIFIVNSCRCHRTYNQFMQSSLETERNRLLAVRSEKRNRLYRWLLDRIPVENRITVFSRLRQDIFVPICDGKLDPSVPEMRNVLADALVNLTSPELCQLHSGGATPLPDGQDGTEEEAVQGLDSQGASSQPANGPGGARTKAKIIARLYDIDMKEETVPVLLDLKRKLEESRSPLLGDVRQALSALLRPHRDVLDIIIQDATLRTEIEYDMQHEAAVPNKNRSAHRTSDVGHLRDITNSASAKRARRRSLVGASPLGTPVGSRQGTGSGGDIIVNGDPKSDRRLANTIAASPRLEAISMSNRKQTIVLDINSGELLSAQVQAGMETARRLELM